MLQQQIKKLFAWLCHEQQFLDHILGKAGKLQPPFATIDGRWNKQEKDLIRGSPDTVKNILDEMINEIRADEVNVITQV
ncbi:hypothetical protein [Brevibacillus reuszeri]|uniref:hypothetical protein n=1 Tax=Brevibacillus reuszeri TaxID=54915 RepID=UPI003D206C05